MPELFLRKQKLIQTSSCHVSNIGIKPQFLLKRNTIFLMTVDFIYQSMQLLALLTNYKIASSLVFSFAK